MNKRPIAVLVIACLYILIGVGATIGHSLEFKNGFATDIVWAMLVNLAGLMAGVYMLRAANWARWLAIGWIGFHVVLSAFHNMREMAIHALFCAVIAYFLLRPEATRYFRSA